MTSLCRDEQGEGAVHAVEAIDSRVGREPLFGIAATRAREGAARVALPSFTLMARAGEAVARLALAVAPHARTVLVFAGPGNNGGDGIEAATRLAAFGRDVRVLRIDDGGRVPVDAALALGRADNAGVRIEAFSSADGASSETPDLVVDALFGIGASRPPEGVFEAAIAHIAAHSARGVRVLAVDVPSGFDAERGQPLGPSCVRADDTLTLLTLKPGLFTGAGRDHAGRIWCASLGVDADERADAWLVGRNDPSCQRVARRHSDHKGSFGDVAVVGGAPGMAGAAWLAARAAHAAGAGRVFVDLIGAEAAAPAIAFDPLRPELMFRADWWRGAKETLAQTTVVCGCGGSDAVRAALPRLLSIVPRLVVDADALNAIAIDPSLQTMLAARAERRLATILTPHPLEAARLLDTRTAAVQADRLRAARELAERFHAVVVLKGSGTVIAGEDEPARVNMTGNASLASAGTGDVLAGWIGGRWASQQATALDVATRGVIEHGAAAEPEGRGSMRAGDLVEALHALSRRA